MSDKKYTASCFCGDVEFELSGEPKLMAYCHCNSCRHWAAGTVSAFTLWQPEDIKITKGEDNIGTYSKTPQSNRKWCKKCGGHLYTEHPEMGLDDVPVAVIKDFDFKPAIHVHYQESVVQIKDGLPKFKDLPKEAGGSGEELQE
ncbi:MAG: GFA family protein [Candidatus Dadabacteria bacterium]|nr:GFA family protein [Candidatus Dadabacteria bacterium]NIQ15855.1 GFA family protein [Candidatus Dadabacteria bacterium]